MEDTSHSPDSRIVGGLKAQFRLAAALVWLLPLAAGCTDEQPERPAAAEASAQATGGMETVETAAFQTISPAQARRLLERRDDALLIDVRTQPERNRIRIQGSRPVEIGDVLRGTVELPHDRAIVLLCAVGGRSYIAGKVLAARGYREIYNLDGGIEAWHRAGLPVEIGPENSK